MLTFLLGLPVTHSPSTTTTLLLPPQQQKMKLLQKQKRHLIVKNIGSAVAETTRIFSKE